MSEVLYCLSCQMALYMAQSPQLCKSSQTTTPQLAASLATNQVIQKENTNTGGILEGRKKLGLCLEEENGGHSRKLNVVIMHAVKEQGFLWQDKGTQDARLQETRLPFCHAQRAPSKLWNWPSLYRALDKECATTAQLILLNTSRIFRTPTNDSANRAQLFARPITVSLHEYMQTI